MPAGYLEIPQFFKIILYEYLGTFARMNLWGTEVLRQF